MAKGIDIGTCFLVGASYTDGTEMASVNIRSIRDTFLDMDNETPLRNMLKMNKVPFIEKDDTLYVLGDSALPIANILKKEVRRPLAQGVISSGEREAEKILILLLKEVIGAPQQEGEVVYYSVPAAPIDKDADIVYHEAMFKKILESFGYRAVAMNEAAAVVYSNASEEMFSALGLSFGAGMTNAALLYRTVPGMKFSVARGGDWIDAGAAKATSRTSAHIMTIKEQGIDLLDPTKNDKGEVLGEKNLREREAVVVYYRNLIHYVVENIKKEFRKSESSVQIDAPIPIIVSGGTAKAGNFLPFFKQEFSKIKDFPFEVSEIRMAGDPLSDVAKGLLIAASLE
jgi:actin-like ATPase involved in cell morphogenesis